MWFKYQSLGCTVKGLGFEVEAKRLDFRVYNCGFWVQGVGCRV